MEHYPRSNVSSQLDSCMSCGQILAMVDKQIHSQAHNLDSDFPALWHLITKNKDIFSSNFIPQDSENSVSEKLVA